MNAKSISLFYCLILVICLYNPLYSALSIDSLKNTLSQSSDIQKANTYEKIGNEYFELNQFESALIHYQKSFQLYNKLKNKEGIKNILFNIGKTFQSMGAFDEALNYFFQYRKQCIHLNDQSNLASALNRLGAVYWSTGNYEKSLENFHEAIKIHEMFKDTDGIATITNNIGLIHYHLREYDKAMDHFHKSKNLFIQLRNDKKASMIINNIGTINNTLGDYDNALKNYFAALEFEQENDNLYLLAITYNNIGNTYKELSETKKALEYYNKSLEINNKINNKTEIANNLNNIGEMYIILKNYTKSRLYLEGGLKYSKETGIRKEILDSYALLSKLYFEQEDYKTSYSYLNKYSELKDSIYDIETSEKLTEMQIKYETEKKEKELELSIAKNNILTKNAKIQENHRKFLIAAIIAIVIASISVIIIFRQKNKALNQSKLLLIKEKKIQDLAIKNTENKNIQLQSEIKYKSRELSTITMHIYQKNELLTEILSKLEIVISNDQKDCNNEIKAIRNMVAANINLDDDWENFKLHFEKVHTDFFERLKVQYQKLSQTDLRHCAYIKMSLSTKEISRLLNINPTSVQISRVRLKKKLGLSKETDLLTYIQNY